jgi:hypothetical protein
MSFQQAKRLRRNYHITSRSPDNYPRAHTDGPMAFLLTRSLLIKMGIFTVTVCNRSSTARSFLTSSSETWFRVLVKTVSSTPPGYSWHEMTFCSRWDLQGCIVLCVGVDLTFQYLLQQALSRMWLNFPPSEPFSLHVPLIHAIVELQDSAVWSIRDIIRTIEKASVTKTVRMRCTKLNV